MAAATTTGLPVRGVLHAAGVVEDSALGGITGELLERCWAPKVVGAWNLHRVTAGEPLDWFCLFSSAAALVGPRDKAPTPRRIAGSMHSPTGGAPRAFPRPRSRGVPGQSSDAQRASRKT